MTISQPFGDFTEQNSISDITQLTSIQLANLVDTLCRKVIEENVASNVKDSLQTLRDQLTQNAQYITPERIQLSNKTLASICYAQKKYFDVKRFIENGVFDEEHHPFFQELYRKIYKKLIDKHFSRSDYCSFPLSIDRIMQDGVTKSKYDYIQRHYREKKAMKKSLDANLVAEKLGLSIKFVEFRFQTHREEMSKRRSEAQIKVLNVVDGKSKSKKEKGISSKVLMPSNNVMAFNSYQEFYHHYQNHFLTCSPATENHEFPTTRVPLDQPLSIEIPEDFPMYFPFF